MARLFSLSIRNVARNRRRSAITMLSVLLGATAIIFLQGLVNGFVKSMVATSILSKTGAIQVHRQGFLGADDPLKLDVPHDGSLEKKILAVPGVTAVAPRLQFEGMLSNGATSTMFMATAIDPESEYKVCPKRMTAVAAGSVPIRPGRPNDMLIGMALASGLDAKQGSTLTIQTAMQSGGGTNAMDVNVSGFLPSRFIIESKRMATVPLAFAQDLLRMDRRVTEFVVGADLDKVDEVAARVRAALGPEYEVTTWRERDAQMRDVERNMGYVLFFIALVLFLLVASGIVNTMLMSVYERVREIGTMLAVGVRRRQVLGLFLGEALTLGAGGALGGTILGTSLVTWLNRRGMTVSPPGGDQPLVIVPFVDAKFVAGVIAFAVIGTMLAALWPAWKASRLRPVEALRAT